MAFQKNETVSITVKIQGDEARNKLAILEKEAKGLEKALREAPKGSAEWAELNKQLNANTTAQTKLRSEIGVTGLTYKQLQTEVRNLYKELNTLTPGTTDFINKSKQLKEVESRMGEVRKEMKGLGDDLDDPNKKGVWGKLSSGFNVVRTAAMAFMALQVVQTVLGWGKAIFDITAKFQGYDKVLTNALGNQEEARQSMEAIKKMAVETAFGVDELTEGYIKMVNRGIRPSKAEMIALGDLAASQGKSFDQLIEAVLDAQTGENERLKEFGVKARKEGDSVALTFKGQTTVVKQNEQAIYDALIAMGQMTGVAGQNAAMMETMGGKVSNIDDAMDNLMLTVGDRLTPIFVFFLDLIGDTIEWFGDVVNASDPVVKVFQDIFAGVGQMVGAFLNLISSVFPGVTSGGNTLNFIMQAIAVAFRYTLVPIQAFIGVLTVAYDVMAGVIEGGKAVAQLLSGDLTGAAASFGKATTNFTAVKTHATDTFNRIKDGWKDAFVTTPTKTAPEAAFAAKKVAEGKEDAVTEAEKKAAEKRQKENKKALDKKQKDEQKHLDDVKKDNEKALELLAQLESEHDTQVATTSLEKEEAKIEEKRRKRLKEINDSLADEKNKEAAREAINRNAEEAISLVRTQYRDKQYKADAEAAAKRLAAENFIRDQERSAEMAILDWKEIHARGNATKLAAIKKERADTELRYTQEKLQAELISEQAKAATEIQDTETLANTLQAIEDRIHAQSVAAEAKAADAKKQIDADLRKQKEENLRGYSDMFSALLQGDLSAFASAASGIVSGHKNALQERLTADMGYYQMGADMANQAVSFLNDLAQRKAEKAIAEANRERDEKVAILNNELAVTESMISSHSNYVQALKTAEKDRLAQLQAALTSETTTEEEKRQAMLKFYSDQFQQMKEAEEQKITDLQRLANMAKTEDEKRAIEEKIRLAENESAEKIRLAEEELQAKKQAIQDIEDFSAESSDNMLDAAQQASDKQLEMADQEAVLKMEFKQDLEETIAAENRKARATEAAEKKKAWEAQKKADIATALITGALAVLKALANFFPLNIILAASAAVLTGVQVAKIKNQSPPAFAHGGFVAQGSAHGSSYGTGGIALIDRGSGREVGEMEGDEAIISKEQTAANWPFIQKMFANARTPGLKNTPVAGLPAFAEGGFVSPYWQKDMYLFGAKKKKKEAEAAAAAAEAEAAAAQKEADAYGGSVEFDSSGAASGDTSGAAQTADAQAAHEAAQKQGEEQIKTLKGILEASEANGEAIAELGNVMLSVKDSVNAVRAAVDENTGATRGVEGAVRGNHNNHLLNEIMSRISALAA